MFVVIHIRHMAVIIVASTHMNLLRLTMELVSHDLTNFTYVQIVTCQIPCMEAMVLTITEGKSTMAELVRSLDSQYIHVAFRVVAQVIRLTKNITTDLVFLTERVFVVSVVSHVGLPLAEALVELVQI